MGLYLDGLELPCGRLRFFTQLDSQGYELTGLGEAEVLKGARLAQMEAQGVFRYGGEPEPGEYVTKLMEMVEKAKPVRLVYTGKGWDVNFLCSVQRPEFVETGGCFDVEYRLKLKKWVEIAFKSSEGSLDRATGGKGEGGGQSSAYTIKKGDTLSRIAKCVLGDSSRWREIYALNKEGIKNPNLIYPGQEIILPQGASGVVWAKKSTANKSGGQAPASARGAGPGGSAAVFTKSTGGVVSKTIAPSEAFAKSMEAFGTAKKQLGPFVSADTLEKLYDNGYKTLTNIDKPAAPDGVGNSGKPEGVEPLW